MNFLNSQTGRAIAAWLGLGVVIGGLSIAALQSSNLGPNAYAQRAVTGRPIGNLKTSSLEMLRSLDEAFSSVSSYALSSVAHIRAERNRSTDGGGRFMGVTGGEGSGVIYRPDGWIVTNDHVVANFEKVTVTLHDGREYPGKVIRAEDTDIAVVKVEAKDLPALPFADSNLVRPGQFAIAVGSPFGLENSVTIGHVSALDRNNAVSDPRTAMGFRQYSDMIQTDAAINMGNSGGPLVNVDGQVIGINTAIFSPSGENIGIGFAIPANQARAIADNLIDRGKVVRGFLGVAPTNLKEYQRKDLGLEGGALVAPFVNEIKSPARDAGIKEGDVIVKIGSIPIRYAVDLRIAMLRFAPGETVKVEVVREGKRQTFEVKVGEPPKELVQNRQQPQPRTRRDNEFFRMFPEDIPGIEEFRKRFGSPDEEPRRQQPSGKPRLGVSVETPSDTLRKQFHVPEGEQGAVVMSVEEGSPAERIGLQVGDLIQELGDKKIRSVEDLVSAISEVKPGEVRRLKFVRHGENSKMVQIRDVRF